MSVAVVEWSLGVRRASSLRAAQTLPGPKLLESAHGLTHDVGRNGMTDQEALGFGALQFGQRLKLTNAFDPFCHHVEAERVAHGDDCAYQRA